MAFAQPLIALRNYIKNLSSNILFQTIVRVTLSNPRFSLELLSLEEIVPMKTADCGLEELGICFWNNTLLFNILSPVFQFCDHKLQSLLHNIGLKNRYLKNPHL